MKICIVGIGATGGFLGGELVKKLSGTEDKVYFMARGLRKEYYRKHGLMIHSDLRGDYRVRPYGIGETAGELGVMDVIFLCVKSYDLEAVCCQIWGMIGPETVVVSLVDGVDSGKKAAQWLGRGLMVDGAFYVSAESQPDFSIRQKGSFCDLYVGFRFADKAARKCGCSETQRGALEQLSSMFEDTGIICNVEDDIEPRLWKRFLLACAYNTVTAAYACSSGWVRWKKGLQVDLKGVLIEGAYLLRLKHIPISGEIEEKLLNHVVYELLPDTNSPMCLDLENGRPLELDIFSGYLLDLGDELLIDPQTTRRLHQAIEKRQAV